MAKELNLCLFVCVAVVLTSGTLAQWTGYVNTLTSTLSYNCPGNAAVGGIASDFSLNDRRWQFYCTSGGNVAGVNSTCTIQPAINLPRGDINFACPGTSYIGGLFSTYNTSASDRIWQPYCCVRPYSSLVSCAGPPANWANLLSMNLNYSAGDPYVITGLYSFYSNLDLDRRWRFSVCQIQVNCGDPGTPLYATRTNSTFLYQSSVTYTCNNGYYQSSGPTGGVRVCQNTGIWSDTAPVCTPCTNISNCIDIRCTNSTNQQCAQCASSYGTGRGQIAYKNVGNTSCQALCSWKAGLCYPGVCPDIPSSCNCSAGFTTEDCLTMVTSPSLLSCVTTLQGNGSSLAPQSCTTNGSSPTYINFVPTSITASWASYFVGPVPPPYPAYIGGFQVGINQSEIRTILSLLSNPSQPVSTIVFPCKSANTTTALSSNSPFSGLLSCSMEASSSNLSAHRFMHGESFTIEAYVTGGGYLDVLNLDNNATTRAYYLGVPSVGLASFVFDLLPPTHCSLTPGYCSYNQPMLDLGADLRTSPVATGSSQVVVRWGGWTDAPSGVQQYTLTVYRLVPTTVAATNSSALVEDPSGVINSTTVQHAGGSIVYQWDAAALPGDGAYSCVMRVQDFAGNVQLARRLLLLDATSALSVDAAAPLRVVSAVPQSGLLWQNSTGNPLVVSGRGHFYDTNLRTVDWLAPVLASSGAIGGTVSPSYDQPTSGGYPRNGTANALGVVQLWYDYVVGYLSPTPPVNFRFQTSDLAISGVTVNYVGGSDGSVVQVWFQAIDFKSQRNVDSVYAYLDSSPPVLQGLTLQYAGQSLALLGSSSLLSLQAAFKTSDPHSGLVSITWSIVTVNGGNLVGSGTVPVIGVNSTGGGCLPSSCVCNVLGQCFQTQYSFAPISTDFPPSSSSEALHDTDYYLTVTSTNGAYLTTPLTLLFTVDTTPPQVGAVFDGPPGGGDLDYQQSLVIGAYWAGFFDPETDVSFYQYQFGTRCQNASAFALPLGAGSAAQQTRGSAANWTAPTYGTYYVTLVAYNQALQPSAPLCSDGITLDGRPPSFAGVVIPGARVYPGLVRDSSSSSPGGVWLVRANRELVAVTGSSPSCTLASYPLVDLSVYPLQSGPSIAASEACSLYKPFSPQGPTFVPTPYAINVSWYAQDDVGIRDYAVATARSQSQLSGASFNSTGRLPYFSLGGPSYDVGGSFYVALQAWDLAGYSVNVTLGPLLVEVTPPAVMLNGSLGVSRVGDFVMVSWGGSGVFSDSQDPFPLTLDYAVGHSPYTTDVSGGFAPVPDVPKPPCTNTSCVSIDMSSATPLLTYAVTLRATNAAGLTSFAVSGTYTHVTCLKTLDTVVIDVDPTIATDPTSGKLNLAGEDVDMVVDSSQLSARWLQQPGTTQTFVAVGTTPGSADVVGFTGAGNQTTYTFGGLVLSDGVRYYVTVAATNLCGQNVSATSDGVVALQGMRQALLGAVVRDGASGTDLDYQMSSSVAAANWAFPIAISGRVSHYLWGLTSVGEDNETVLASHSVGPRTAATSGGLDMPAGELYVSAVQACFGSALCLPPVYSDGFAIAAAPTVGAGQVNATYYPIQWDPAYSTSNSGVLQLSWTPFSGPPVSFYRWALGTGGSSAQQLLTDWHTVPGTTTSVRANLGPSPALPALVPITATVVGYNVAGLYAATSGPLAWVGGQTPSSPLVYDVPASLVPQGSAGDDWRQLEYRATTFVDIDYARSQTSLSAAWPSLRYSRYNYSVSLAQGFQPCGSAAAIACGSTIANALTVSRLSLQHGLRYYFCVRALDSDVTLVAGGGATVPPALTACSSGVTVDLVPPVGGCVQIVPAGAWGPSPPSACVNASGFQASTTELQVVWSAFQDVPSAVHISGVAYYQYAIGTAPGATDVVDFVTVGLRTDAVASGLTLQPQLTYYATVRGYDFTGQWGDAHSLGVTVDDTPPSHDSMWLGSEIALSLNSGYSVAFGWSPVVDTGSGVVGLDWCFGSRPGTSDLHQWTGLQSPYTLRTAAQGLGLADGQLLFASMLAQNGAGLTSVRTSLGYLIDSTPPIPGAAYDGPSPPTSSASGAQDLDFTADHTSLTSHWSDFFDPHSGVAEYLWAIGTCPGCSDVQAFLSVGLGTQASRSGLSLSRGTSYYVTVKGCNGAGLCSQVSTNGIAVDPSPPVPGQVLDGCFGRVDVQYQASRSVIAACWTGFHDPFSSILYYVVSAGLSQGAANLVPPTTLPPSETSRLFSVSALPTATPIYVTVQAFNGAGLGTVASSNGFVVDGAFPKVTSPIAVDTAWAGSLVPGSQYASSALRVRWSVNGTWAPVNQTSWSLVPRAGVSFPLSPQQAAGLQSSAVATGISLSDGELYQPTLTACSAAGLCAQGAVGGGILVDSSPPVDGYFAAASAPSAAQVRRAVPGGLVWTSGPSSSSNVTLAFIGFSDPHSGIASYWGAVGSSYGQSDLSSGSVQLRVTLGSDNLTLLATVTLAKPLNGTAGQVVFVSLWALNGVGLRSRVVQGSFRLDLTSSVGKTSNGTLTLLRSYTCPVASCAGHCTCAARGQLCSVPAYSACAQVAPSSLPASSWVNVTGYVPQSPAPYGSPGYTAVADKLVGSLASPTTYKFMEWTFGSKGMSPGVGVLDAANDPVWNSMLPGDTAAVFSVSPSYPLRDGMSYVFYVRAWLNATSSVTFSTAGVTVDLYGPQAIGGLRVKEVLSSSPGGGVQDIDFSPNVSSVVTSWAGVFVANPSSALTTYSVGLGDTPGSANVRGLTQAQTTSATFSGLTLTPGVRYYAVVVATSPLQASTVSVSDGFVVDVTPPLVGEVVDGWGYGDLKAHTNTTTYAARWFGFSDPTSGIHHYELAVTNATSQPSSYVGAGIGLRSALGYPGMQGAASYGHVVAVSNAGLRSADAASDGVTLDTTRPTAQRCTSYSPEVLGNPSFEGSSSSCGLSSSPTVAAATSSWQLAPSSAHAEVLPVHWLVPPDGCSSLLVRGGGSVSQTFPTAPNATYRLLLALNRYGDVAEGAAVVRAHLLAPGVNELLPVNNNNNNNNNNSSGGGGYSPYGAWSRYEVYFTAVGATSTITISPASEWYSVALDAVSVTTCSSTSELTSGPATVQWGGVISIGRSFLSSSSSSPSSSSNVVLHANWRVSDAESGVRGYAWAVGTVPGGEQLMGYTSAGGRAFGTSGPLEIKHGMTLYLSVLTWNNAGLERVVYSEGFPVDFTPPTLIGGGVVDGAGPVDLNYQSSGVVEADWASMIDLESGIAMCRWAIGTSPEASDIQPYSIASSTGGQSVNLTSSSSLPHGTKVYTTVVCTNGAGLSTLAHSDGLTLLTLPPTSSNATLLTSGAQYTAYDVRPGYTPTNGTVLSWSGFGEPAGTPLQYQVRRDGGGWVSLGYATQVGLSDLGLVEGVASAVQVRALNMAGVPSLPVEVAVTILPNPPQRQSSVNISWSWTAPNQLSFNWTGLFTSPGPAIYYEYSLGENLGGTDVVRWGGSLAVPSATIAQPWLSPASSYFFMLTAYTPAGLHTSVNAFLSATNVFG